jgi:two-component system, NarL family, nitrate/nitrite response regulator NarL
VLKSSQEIDIILLDLDLGPEKGADFLDQLDKLHFTGKVLLVTAGVSDAELPGLIRKGIAGIFLKHGSPTSLIQGIRDTIEGKALFDQDMLRRALQAGPPGHEEPTRARLTERERRVLSFVFEGLANKQIADRLQISETSVKASLQQLFAKTGVRTRSQLVRIALEQFRDEL